MFRSFGNWLQGWLYEVFMSPQERHDRRVHGKAAAFALIFMADEETEEAIDEATDHAIAQVIEEATLQIDFVRFRHVRGIVLSMCFDLEVAVFFRKYCKQARTAEGRRLVLQLIAALRHESKKYKCFLVDACTCMMLAAGEPSPEAKAALAQIIEFLRLNVTVDKLISAREVVVAVEAQ